MPDDGIELRKADHIALSLDADSQGSPSFGRYRLPYDALPELSLAEVSTRWTLGTKQLDQPLIIASMTGGSEHGRAINTHLAIAAEECRVALGVGSQRIGLEQPDARDTFELVRRHAPSAFVFANFGAAQLNLGHGLDSVRKIIDMIEADALYVHLNPLQEALQPGGDTNFSGLEPKLAAVVAGVGVPVFVKEVGHGIAGSVARRLFDLGVSGIDVAGVGGTSYAWIEARRAKNSSFEEWFRNHGLPTTEAVREVVAALPSGPGVTPAVVASGGVRSPVDGLKARALGADFYSAARPFLIPAMESAEATIGVVTDWQHGLQIAMFASAVRDWAAARDLTLIGPPAS